MSSSVFLLATVQSAEPTEKIQKFPYDPLFITNSIKFPSLMIDV
jgi:hypothetical protein